MKYEYLKASVDRLNYKPGMLVSVRSNSDNRVFNWFEDIPSLLDEFGKEGWELVHFERDSKLGNDWEMFFKRSDVSGCCSLDEHTRCRVDIAEELNRDLVEALELVKAMCETEGPDLIKTTVEKMLTRVSETEG